jgi:hypothetical protein
LHQIVFAVAVDVAAGIRGSVEIRFSEPGVNQCR